MEQLRVAIIGSGGMAHTRAALSTQHERVQITCASSRNAVTGPALAARYEVAFVERWQDAVTRDDVDAVFVCTHNDSHASIARAALEAGKHTFVEYPLATTAADADALVELSRRRKLALHVGHDQAFVGWHLGIKQVAASMGKLQAVNGILATPTRGGGRSVWRNKALSGPPFMVGIAYVFHLIDLFGTVEWVEGTSSYEAMDDATYYRSSVSTCTMAFSNGGVAQLLYIRGFAVPKDEQEQAMMFANGFLSYRGYVSGSRTNEGHLTRVTHAGSQRLEFPGVTLAQACRHNTDLFVRHALDGTASGPDVSLAREAVLVALAAEQASQENRRVSVPRLASVAV